MDESPRLSSVFKSFHFITSYLGGLFMRQAFRRYAFPMMIIAAVLAAALPLTVFAENLPYDFLFAGYTYVYAYTGSNSRSLLPTISRLYGFPGPYATSSIIDVDFAVSDLGSPSFYSASSTIDVRLPLYRSGISSLDFNFFFGCTSSGTSSLASFNVDSIYFKTSSGDTIEVSDYSVSTNRNFKTTSTSNSSSGFYQFKSCNLHFASTSYYDITDIHIIFNWSDYTHLLSDTSNFYFGIAPDSTLTTLNGQTESLLKSLGIIASILQTIQSSNLQSDAQIISYLSDILAAIQAGGGTGSGGSGSDPGTGEGEDILQEGAIKQEQLEDLGDALSNVPKPSIENITQSFDPADTLISADPGMIQNALSIVYSWDKFLILLGLFIAVGTISYIIFGKKS